MKNYIIEAPNGRCSLYNTEVSTELAGEGIVYDITQLTGTLNFVKNLQPNGENEVLCSVIEAFELTGHYTATIRTITFDQFVKLEGDILYLIPNTPIDNPIEIKILPNVIRKLGNNMLTFVELRDYVAPF